MFMCFEVRDKRGVACDPLEPRPCAGSLWGSGKGALGLRPRATDPHTSQSPAIHVRTAACRPAASIVSAGTIALESPPLLLLSLREKKAAFKLPSICSLMQASADFPCNTWNGKNKNVDKTLTLLVVCSPALHHTPTLHHCTDWILAAVKGQHRNRVKQ